MSEIVIVTSDPLASGTPGELRTAVSLPVCDRLSFEAVFSFAAKVREVQARAGTVTLRFTIAQLLTEPVRRILLVRRVVLGGTSTTDDLKQLLQVVAPKSDKEREVLLHAIHFGLPHECGHGAAGGAFLAFADEFRELVMALDIPVAFGVKELPKALPAYIADLVRPAFRMRPPKTIDEAVGVIVAFIDKIDENADLGWALGRPPTKNVDPKGAKLGDRAPKGRQAQGEKPSEVAGVERERRPRGACFKCGVVGHFARECPRAHATMTAAAAGGAGGAGKQEAAKTSPPAAPVAPRRSTRATAGKPPEKYGRWNAPGKEQGSGQGKTGKVDFCVEVCGKGPVVEEAAPAEAPGNEINEDFDFPDDPPHEIADAEEDGEETCIVHAISEIIGKREPSDTRPGIVIEGNEGKSTARRFMAVVDTGADRSHVNEEFAREIGLRTEVRGATRRFRVANGACEETARCVPVQARLTPDAPAKEIEFWVTPSIPPGRYALLGHRDLAGYAVQFSKATPSVVYLAPPDVEDVADAGLPDMIPTAAEAAEDKTPPRERWRLVQLGDRLLEDETRTTRVRDLLEKYAEVFEPLDELPARLPAFRVELIDPQAIPFRARVRPQPPNKREFIDAEVARQLALGLIAEARPTPWASGVVVATNTSGKLRMCIDYVELNKRTIRDAYPIPDVTEIFHWLADWQWMAKTDMASGYNQVVVDPASTDVLAFICHAGLYTPNRMPFGPTNAPAHFGRSLHNAFRDLPNSRIFFDDCPTAAKTFDEFYAALGAFLERCRTLHIRLNPGKCIVGPKKLKLIGRLVGPGSIEIDPEGVRPLAEMRPPQNKAELHSFLGLAQWFGPFVHDLATKAGELWPLIKKDAAFLWGEEEDRAFRAVRDAIVNAGPLAQFHPGAPIVVRPDFSTIGLGGGIYQRSEQGDLEPLLFYSRKLSDAEKKYSTIEGECLAIVAGFEKGRPFILPATTVSVWTDHSNLQFLRTSQNRRVQHWALTLSEFCFDVVYCPGTDNAVGDCLSRLIPGTIAPGGNNEVEAVKEDQGTTDTLAETVHRLPHVLVDGTIVLNNKPPAPVIGRLWALAHSDALSGHFGAARTIQIVAGAVKWAGMQADLHSLSETCATCQKIRARVPRPAEILTTRASAPFESVFIDYLGPLREQSNKSYVFAAVDRFSHYVVLAATADTSAATTVALLWELWITRFGPPSRLTSDGASAFTGRALTAVTDRLKIDHHVSCPGHPEGHGAVERANLTIAQVLRAHFRKVPDWPALVAAAAFAINTAPTRVLGCSPFEVVHGFKPRLMLHHVLARDPRGLPGVDRGDPAGFAEALVTHAAALHARVRAAEERAYRDAATRIAANAQKPGKFSEGDFVLVHHERTEKIDVQWAGPFEVVEVEADYLYKIRNILTNDVRRAHANSLARFYPGALSDEQLRVEALGIDEALVDLVDQHRLLPDGTHEFHLKWVGSQDWLWIKYADCRFTPKVKAYIALHKLKVRLHPRK